jgi:integrase
VGLRRKDIDLKTGFATAGETRPVTMSGKEVVKGPKSKAGERKIAIPPDAIAGLTHHMDTFVGRFPEGLVFIGDDGERYPVRTLYERFDKARKAIGRPEVTLHDLRHVGLSWAD